jgi:hypothetical protein
MFFRFFAMFFLFSAVALSQSIDPTKVAVVHVYRQGRLLVAVMVSADGNKIVSLYPQKMATFYLAPGYHELTMGSRESSPSATFRAEAGGEYFFHVDYEHVVSATSIRDLKASLSVESSIADAVALREVTIDPDRLVQILAQSNSSRAELEDSSSTGAHVKPAE